MQKTIFLILFLMLFAFSAQSAENLSSVARSDKWLAIGHYQNNTSSIDSQKFFLSPDGKQNPLSELKATIKLFNSSDDKTKCLFPSRYLFLKSQNLISRPFPQCSDFIEFKSDLRPQGVTLLFTDAYMNNPSSMFGHTLLRIDTSRKGTQLLAHGANYGAFTGDTSGVTYAILGLTGGYMGGFTVKPYYDIINTYNNIENRDIWELNLDLSLQELEFFVAHLWEIGQTQSKYFFFSRNCSYMLLEMLDAVRPSLKLAAQFPYQVIPLDSFKAVYNSKDLVKSVNFRPSRQNKIKHRYKLMNNSQKQAYLNLIKNPSTSLPADLTNGEKADILETYYQYIQYLYVAKKLELNDYRNKSFNALRLRSVISEPSSISELNQGKSPLLSHSSKRLVTSFGFKDNNSFESIEFRPAYQSLTDNAFGLPYGSEINFLSGEARYYNNSSTALLENLDILSIRSISPVDAMFTPVSFQINLNINRWHNPEIDDYNYLSNLKIGSGGAYALNDNFVVFSLFDTIASYSGALNHNSMLGFAFDFGLLSRFGKFNTLFEIKPQISTAKIGNQTSYEAELNYIIDTNLSLSSKAKFIDQYGADTNEFMLGLRYYF